MPQRRRRPHDLAHVIRLLGKPRIQTEILHHGVNRNRYSAQDNRLQICSYSSGTGGASGRNQRRKDQNRKLRNEPVTPPVSPIQRQSRMRRQRRGQYERNAFGEQKNKEDAIRLGTQRQLAAP